MNKLIIRRLSSSTFMTAQQNFEYLASLGILVFDLDYTGVNSRNCSNHECLSFCCQFCKGSLMKVHYPKLYNMAQLLSLNVFTASKGSNNYISFAITAAGVVPCGGHKKCPCTSSIKQILFFFHEENMSVTCLPPYTPLLYCKTGVYRGIPIFLIFVPTHRLWVLVRTASGRRF